jgi:hypothetical protein
MNRLSIVTILAVLAGSAVRADVINVPGEFGTIQEAIDAARDGDQVVIAPGTYFETIDLLGKAITVRSTEGPRVTIVRGGDPVFSCVNGEGPDTVIEGLTIAAGRVGMRNVGSSPTIDRCVFANHERGMTNVSAEPTVTNCLFTGNSLFVGCFSGTGGAGMYNADSSPLVTNCVFAGNLLWSDCCPDCLPPGLTSGGSAMHSDGGTPVVSNCVVWGNSINGEQTTVRYSNVQGGWDGAGADNIDADPLFVLGPSGTWTDFEYDAVSDLAILTDKQASFEPGGLVGNFVGPFTYIGEEGPAQRLIVANTATAITAIGFGLPLLPTYQVDEYRLLPGSPCIDAADNTAVPFRTTDLDGNPRFVDDPDTPDTGNGDPPIVDIGPYEYQAVSPCPWDLDRNGSVATADLLQLLGAWGSDPGGPPDFDGDMNVGTSDLLKLLGAWGPCP